MRRGISMLLIICLMLTGCGSAAHGSADQAAGATADSGYQIAEGEKLVIYTSHKEEVYGPIIREFEERTGIFVEVRQGGSLELFDEIADQAGEQACDVMFGGGIENYIAYQDYLEAYRVSEEAMIDERYRCNGHMWTAFSVLPIVLIYNNKLVDPEDAPETWSELLTERWKGKVAFADPVASGSSYTALCTMIQAMDCDENTVLQNFTQILDGHISESSGAVLDEVDSGTMLVGVTLEETARTWIDQGADLSYLYPGEGTSAVPDAVAIIKDAPHRENAQKFLDFTVSRDVQTFLTEKLFRQTVRTDIEGAGPKTEQDAGMQTIDYDVVWAAGERDTILAKWTELQEEP